MKKKLIHRVVKRTFDLCFSASVLAVSVPILAAIALAIRCTSSGKAIYSQERIGRNGRVFRCYKFRTMYQDADERLKDMLDKNPLLAHEWKHCRKIKHDPRVTFIGRFLRKTSFDELPQFWNVLKGDLSVVGPRPVMQEEVIHYLGVKAAKILSVKPGITGIWQVSGRSDTSYAKRIQLDEKYVENHSILLDLKLIVKTIPAMINSKGAY